MFSGWIKTFKKLFITFNKAVCTQHDFFSPLDKMFKLGGIEISTKPLLWSPEYGTSWWFIFHF